jgi:type II secretory pathway pseudopilin PulG
MKPISRHHSAAFSLVEVTLALGVAAFALVAIFGLLPVGLNSNLASINQTTAASLATRISADLRKAQTVGTVLTSPFYQIPIPKAGAPNTMRTVFLRLDGSAAQSSTPTLIDKDADVTQSPRYRVTVYFYPPQNVSGVVQRTATMARILITWPAIVDKTAATPPKNYSGSFETVVALDLN